MKTKIRRELFTDKKTTKSNVQKLVPIWKLGEIAKKVKSSPLGKLSSDDKLIYEKTQTYPHSNI